MFKIPKKVKYAGNVFKNLQDGIKYGVAGGITGMLMKITGSPFVGQILGGAIAASFMKNETDRKIVIADSFKDAMESLILFGR